jgi:hypothetical protein
MRTLGLTLGLSWITLACTGGTTGSEVVAFEAVGSGPSSADWPDHGAFPTTAGYSVELSTAQLWIGSIYLNERAPAPGSQQLPCILPGTYVGEVLQGTWLDVLNPALQPFEGGGRGIAVQGRSAELWLQAQDTTLDAPNSTAVIATLAGVAAKDGLRWPFQAEVSIGSNRRTADPDPDRPGANPICRERLVRGLEVQSLPAPDGLLTVQVDPRRWVDAIDFTELGEGTDAAAPLGLARRLPDQNFSPAGLALYRGLKSLEGYSVSWQEP